MAEKITLPTSAVLLEMMAAWRAVAFVHELGLNNAILEGDFEIVIKALNHVGPSLSSIVLISYLFDSKF
ncbi:hypothetical protein SO802_001458 [Lithocarpus litseifolius]|uniref:RNase H type-1 domain-containing protein n=1 Tax=Lithocarpus litseifolius TaxID=425828 RepID=A0AAW2DW70_9ROSI